MKLSKNELSQLKELNLYCIKIAGKICQVIQEKEKDLYVEAKPFSQLYENEANLKVWSHNAYYGYCRCKVFLTLDARDGLLAHVTWNFKKKGVLDSKSEVYRIWDEDYYDLACTVVGGC